MAYIPTLISEFIRQGCLRDIAPRSSGSYAECYCAHPHLSRTQSYRLSLLVQRLSLHGETRQAVATVALVEHTKKNLERDSMNTRVQMLIRVCGAVMVMSACV